MTAGTPADDASAADAPADAVANTEAQMRQQAAELVRGWPRTMAGLPVPVARQVWWVCAVAAQQAQDTATTRPRWPCSPTPT